MLAILLGGWASHNKYSLVGALRSAAQMVSYEMPMILGLLVVAMVVGSLSLNAVVAVQGGYHWIAFYAPFTFLLFYVAAHRRAQPRSLRPARVRVGAGRRATAPSTRACASACSSSTSTPA